MFLDLLRVVISRSHHIVVSHTYFNLYCPLAVRGIRFVALVEVFGEVKGLAELDGGTPGNRDRSRSPLRGNADGDTRCAGGGVNKYQGRVCSNAFALAMSNKKDRGEYPFGKAEGPPAPPTIEHHRADA